MGESKLPPIPLEKVIPLISWEYFFFTWKIKPDQEEAKKLKEEEEKKKKEEEKKRDPEKAAAEKRQIIMKKAMFYMRALEEKGLYVPTGLRELKRHTDNMREERSWREGGEIKNVKEWKKGTDPFVMEAYDFLQGFFRLTDGETVVYDNLKHVGMPKVRQNVLYSKDVPYEEQSRKKDDSFAVAGAYMYNRFLQSNNQDDKKNLVTKEQFRKFKVKKKSFKDLQKLGYKIDKKKYEQMSKRVDNYMSSKSETPGNIFEMGDFFFSKRKDIQLKRMRINIPAQPPKETLEKTEKRDILLDNQKAAFCKQVAEVLKTDNVIGLVARNGKNEEHYNTLYRIEAQGDKGKVRLLESDRTQGRNVDRTEDITSVVYPVLQSNNVVELVWIEKLDDPAMMSRKYGNLKYDGKDGFSANEKQKKLDEPELALVQNEGICFRVKNSEMPEYMRGMGIDLSVYVPKKPDYKKK